MSKLILEVKQLPDPLSRFQVVKSQVAYLPKGESIMDPYPYFYEEDRYAVTITFQDGRIHKNKGAVELDGETEGS